MNESEANLQHMVEAAIRDEGRAQDRIGRDYKNWACFFCGHLSSELEPCACPFPQSFHCAGLKSVCPDCRKAHGKVARHISDMFREKVLRHYRVDSRRSRAFRFLRAGLETLAETGDEQAKTLRFLLGANADPRADEPSQFRSAVMDAFARSRFLNFTALARELDEEERLWFIERIATNELFR